MWGIIPAAGAVSRLQARPVSNELLPVGSRIDAGVERPRVVSEYLIDRMTNAGADKICFVISPGKSDLMEYYGDEVNGVHLTYVLQPRPAGLCDSLFRAVPFISVGESVAIGLPETIWFPEDGFARLPSDVLSFLCFPVSKPQFFDAIVADEDGQVIEVQVKQLQPRSNWIWGAVRMPGAVLHELYELWREPGRGDEYLGTLVNAYLERGGRAQAIRAGESFVDVGTPNGYEEAIRLLSAQFAADGERMPWNVGIRSPETVNV